MNIAEIQIKLDGVFDAQRRLRRISDGAIAGEMSGRRALPSAAFNFLKAARDFYVSASCDQTSD